MEIIKEYEFYSDLEPLLSTVAHLLAADGFAREVAILATSNATVRQSGYESYDYGTLYIYTLYLQVPHWLYAQISDIVHECEKRILEKAELVLIPFSEEHDIGRVRISPLLTTDNKWREKALAWVSGDNVNNQGRVRSDNLPSRSLDGLLFRSQPEINLYNALKKEFYLLLEQGLFSVSITSIYHSPTVAKLLNLVQDHRYETLESLYKWHPILWRCYCQVGGGIQHKFLACCGAAWLLDQSYEVEFEVWRDNKCVDIATKTVDWIIECGDTSPAPVFDHLRCSCRYFAVLPFQDFYKENCLEMFVFGYGQNWHQSNVEKILDERLEQQKAVSNQIETAFSALRSGSVLRREVIVQNKKGSIWTARSQESG
jgi:hypothetical protein